MHLFPDSNSVFFGKLLLFGEYTVINGGDSLATILRTYSGSWQQGNLSKEEQDKLFQLSNHIANLVPSFDHNRFDNLVSNGLQFTSTIPQGYGCGSSGSLIAALYAHFCTHDASMSLLDLQHLLGEMESFFHGKSSGIDPLVIFTNQTILTNQNKPIVIDLESSVNKKEWYLIDSKKERKTSNLVKSFLSQRISDAHFSRQVDQLSYKNDLLIQAFLNSSTTVFEDLLHEVSKMQLDIFKVFIPSEIKDLWVFGLDTGDFTLKLCGAGGGGFFLAKGSRPPHQALQISL